MRNKISSKTIAILGITMYVLGVVFSAEDLQGTPRFPAILKLISETGLLIFLIMAVARLWKPSKSVALTLLISNVIFFALALIQEIGFSNVLVPLNLIKVVTMIAFIWAIVTLFQNREA